jgi:N-sulfoglucosamine sulfohydrolase
MRSVLKTIFLCVGLLFTAHLTFGVDKKSPNILWIITDDHGPDAGCYGTPGVSTPNIDRLASEGTRFTHAFTTAPVCSPSRSALITGMYQTSIGAHNHRSHRSDGYTLPKGAKPITELFRQAGYFTANLETISPEAKPSGKTDFNFPAKKIFDGSDWKELKSHQPFYCQINFQAPHRGGAWPVARKRSDRVDPAKVRIPPYYPDNALTRDDWANYLDAVQLADSQIGEVLKKLEQDGLATNTIVFFFGDNGRCMVRDKQWLYDGGLHIPLIVRWPGNLKAGSVRDDLVSAIDISATSLHLAGVPLPASMEGQVFLGPEKKERKYIFGARDRCDETVDRIRSVHTKDFNYIRNFHPESPYTQTNAYKWRQYPVLREMTRLHAEGKLTVAQELFFAPRKPAEELYDLRNDPDEIHNLADSAQHRKTLKELRAAMDQWIKETGDMGAVPEKVSAIEADETNPQAAKKRKQ